MHPQESNPVFPAASRLLLVFCLITALLGGVARPACAQDKAEPATAKCVPSDLSALIVTEGRRVRVTEVKEEPTGKETDPVRRASPDSSSPSEMAGRKEAYRIFENEARRGNPGAMVNLAVSTLAGWGIEPNAGAALYWLNAAGERRYGPALYGLGILYFKGCGVRQDAAEAFHFFELGAHAGYAPAQVNLGYFYDHGMGVKQDHSVAAYWYRQAADSGEAQAQYNLGDLYLHGEGVAKDESVAFALFQKAAIQGHTKAQIMTGSMLAAGRGTPKDLAGAYPWLFAAALQGDDGGTATLRRLEHELSRAEIEEAKLRARSLVVAVEATMAMAKRDLN